MPCYSFHQAADMTNGWPEGIVLAGTTLGKMAFNATVRRPDTLRCNASRSGNRRSGRDCIADQFGKAEHGKACDDHRAKVV
jgi:hypothetical protein